MGNWNINIQGIGCHHNGDTKIDADLAAAEFVKALQKQGHTIEVATFTSGSKVDLKPAEAVRVGNELVPRHAETITAADEGSLPPGVI